MRLLFQYLKPYRKAALLAPAFMLLEVVTNLVQPLLMADIIDIGLAVGDVPYIVKKSLLMITVALFGIVGGLGNTVFASTAAFSFGADLRSALYKKVQSFSFFNLDKLTTPSLITRLTSDVVQIQHLAVAMLRIVVRAPLMSAGGVVMALSINPGLASILLVTVPILAVTLTLVIFKGFPLFALVQKKLDQVNAVMRDNLAGIRVVRAFVRMDFEKQRFSIANSGLRDITVRASRLVGLTLPIMMLIMNLSIVAVVWFGGLRVDSGNMQVGQVMAFINYMTQILFSLMMMAFVFMMLSRAKASADRVIEVLKTKAEIEDLPSASAEPIVRGEIEFRNVSFSYPEAKGEPVLKNISFRAQPGETVAILGATGSGKSSLVHLIPRFYDVSGGQILIDGRDIRTIALKTLRSAIGMVLQDSVMFSGTIAENLRWGNEQATDEELVAAGSTAQAHDFITAFPDGYATAVGQRGVNLSGGQKQRLAIARALLKKPAILILDDSTSAVDMGTEARIQAALKDIPEKTTRLVIAQRISTVLSADKILVLEDGKISAVGSHSELLKDSPVYRDIYYSQIDEEAC